MLLTVPKTPQYFHSAGEVMMAGGPLPMEAATDFFGVLCRLSVEAQLRGDKSGARYCARQGLELFGAIEAADDYRCAAAGIARSASPLAEFRARTVSDLARAA